jgi:hypothetical protein
MYYYIAVIVIVIIGFLPFVSTHLMELKRHHHQILKYEAFMADRVENIFLAS